MAIHPPPTFSDVHIALMKGKSADHCQCTIRTSSISDGGRGVKNPYHPPLHLPLPPIAYHIYTTHIQIQYSVSPRKIFRHGGLPSKIYDSVFQLNGLTTNATRNIVLFVKITSHSDKNCYFCQCFGNRPATIIRVYRQNKKCSYLYT